MKNLVERTRRDLLGVPLPVYDGNSYTVVPHLKAVCHIEDCLGLNLLEIDKESLKLSSNGQIAYGELTLKMDKDPESECLITFLNSYNKQRAFNTRAALRMRDSGNLLVLNQGSYRRVHKGSANEAIEENLCDSVKELAGNFENLINYKESLKNTLLNQKSIFVILGELFFQEKVLNSEQINYVKEQLNNKDYSYNRYHSSAFWLYMLVSSALQSRGKTIDTFVDSHTRLNKYFTEKVG